jgi:hypothetical protein
MSNSPIFCKFAHNATLEAAGHRFRIYWSPDQQYACTSGYHDYQLEPFDCIVGAVHVDELVAHIVTSRHVYEVNARHHSQGAQVTRLGPSLPTPENRRAVRRDEVAEKRR